MEWTFLKTKGHFGFFPSSQQSFGEAGRSRNCSQANHNICVSLIINKHFLVRYSKISTYKYLEMTSVRSGHRKIHSILIKQALITMYMLVLHIILYHKLWFRHHSDWVQIPGWARPNKSHYNLVWHANLVVMK